MSRRTLNVQMTLFLSILIFQENIQPVGGSAKRARLLAEQLRRSTQGQVSEQTRKGGTE